MKKKIKKSISQRDIVFEYFKVNENKSTAHPDVVDVVTEEYREKTGKVFRDPDRAIRKLHQEGLLIKDGKGIYRYDSKVAQQKKLEGFTPTLKAKVFKRDGYKCVICGKGKKEGVDLHADHIKPMDLGGLATFENGQTLCSQHNFLKKNFKQTETGKKMFIRLYELAKSTDNRELIKFCSDVLEVYEKNGINGHIVWEK